MSVILNVGCGDTLMPGAVNLDGPWNPKADVHCDLEKVGPEMNIVRPNSFEVIYLTHVIEHIRNVLPMMECLYNAAKPQAIMYITCPHGASDDADEDPTHVRRLFPLSFQAFAQPYYHKADYGYRGDWQVERVVMLLQQEVGPEFIPALVQCRNVVIEMYAELRAIKPLRDRKATQLIAPMELMKQPDGYHGEPIPPMEMEK